MAEENPLISSYLSTTPSTMIRRYNNGDPLESLARVWPCAACGCLLGVLHLVFGITMLTFDLLTNHVSDTAFATTAALCYLICAILSFIAVRRLDRCALLLLFSFSFFSSVASLAIFLESGALINQSCSTDNCNRQETTVHAILISICLSEWLTCVVTMIVCYRSLRHAYGVSSPRSPYSTLIVGDYSTLRKQPKISDPRFETRHSRAVLQ